MLPVHAKSFSVLSLEWELIRKGSNRLILNDDLGVWFFCGFFFQVIALTHKIRLKSTIESSFFHLRIEKVPFL